ncbi:hypothetical protein MW290_12710 [Aquincola tertiaricarbonis]|uniref:Uncharacterized protein n=1 Tax=Aquincola tertiaricarbonis TaxID=391953 RepID=A0ABY4S133_AQUTE|nr:hypothetical protein [Aquincola tertiaricarbonis]URI06757.1 hypothetical protein MW290_12710 [Aquincola tertiaricarbonis]
MGFEDLRHQDLWHQAGQRRSIHRQPNHLIKVYAVDANAELIRRIARVMPQFQKTVLSRAVPG